MTCGFELGAKHIYTSFATMLIVMRWSLGGTEYWASCSRGSPPCVFLRVLQAWFYWSFSTLTRAMRKWHAWARERRRKAHRASRADAAHLSALGRKAFAGWRLRLAYRGWKAQALERAAVFGRRWSLWRALCGWRRAAVACQGARAAACAALEGAAERSVVAQLRGCLAEWRVGASMGRRHGSMMSIAACHAGGRVAVRAQAVLVRYAVPVNDLSQTDLVAPLVHVGGGRRTRLSGGAGRSVAATRRPTCGAGGSCCCCGAGGRALAGSGTCGAARWCLHRVRPGGGADDMHPLNSLAPLPLGYEARGHGRRVLSVAVIGHCRQTRHTAQ